MVNHIAVIGSGTMGRGVAYAAALAGFNVALQDIKQEAIDKAREYNESLANKSAEKGFIQSEQRDFILNNITYTTDLKEAVQNTDLVVEAVLELMDLKVNIFKQLDELAPAHAILATNTSTMSPTEIGAATNRARKNDCDALL